MIGAEYIIVVMVAQGIVLQIVMICVKICAAVAAVNPGADRTAAAHVIMYATRAIAAMPVKAAAIKHVIQPVAQLAVFVARNVPEGTVGKIARPAAALFALKPAAQPVENNAAPSARIIAGGLVPRLAARAAWKIAAMAAQIAAAIIAAAAAVKTAIMVARKPAARSVI